MGILNHSLLRTCHTRCKSNMVFPYSLAYFLDSSDILDLMPFSELPYPGFGVGWIEHLEPGQTHTVKQS